MAARSCNGTLGDSAVMGFWSGTFSVGVLSRGGSDSRVV